MKSTPSPTQSLQTVKREDFRQRIRKEQLEREWSKKRNFQQQVENTSEEEQFQEQIANNQYDSDQSCDISSSKLQKWSKKPLTTQQAKKLQKYVKREKNKKIKFTYMMGRVYDICAENLHDMKQDKQTIATLIGVFYSSMEFNVTEEKLKEVVQILLKVFCRNPENQVVVFLEKLLSQHPVLVPFLDQCCRDLCLVANLCGSENLNYSQLNMIQFLFQHIRNDQFIEAFQSLGIQQKLQKCSENQNLVHIVSRINQITNNVFKDLQAQN